MKTVYLKGSRVELLDNNFIAQGGEGAVYKKDNLIYKLYLNKIGADQEKKLKYLSILQKDNIIAPKDILYSSSGEPIGYTMKFIDNASALALLFTNSFKKRNNIESKHIEKIFLSMSETIKYIHEKQILIVDGNELNYLIDNSDWSTPYFLDVDSYQTKDFPATAIMPSIRDYFSKNFSEGTDWYSFAVLMFQLYTGIHPYKGNHPKYNIKKDANGNDTIIDNIEQRCLNKISVFNKDVKYPPFVKFDMIPANLNDWFVKTFEKGERLPPPNLIIGLAPRPQVTVNYTQGMTQQLLKEYDSNILHVSFVNGQLLVITEKNYYVGGLQFTKKYTRELPIIFDNKGNIELYHISKGTDSLIVDCASIMENQKLSMPTLKTISLINNRLFAIVDEKLEELEINKYTRQLSVKSVWNVLSNASKFFMNCMYCNSFGNTMFYIPEIKDDVNVLYIKKIKELDNHVILDAFYENGTMVVISKLTDYVKTVIKFDSVFINYTLIQNTCNLQEINATVIANGISIVLDEDNLELSAKFNTDRKIVKVITELTFTHRGNEVLGYKDNKLYSLKLN